GRGQLGDVADADVVGGAGDGSGVGACRGGGGGSGDAHRASCGGVSVGPGRWRAEKKTAGRRRRSFRIRVPCLLRTRSRLVPPGAGKAKEPKVGKEAANHGQAVYEDSPGDATAAFVTCSSNSTRAAGFRSRARPTTGSPSASLAGSILPGPASQSRTARARSRARSASWLSPTGTVASNALAFSETPISRGRPSRPRGSGRLASRNSASTRSGYSPRPIVTASRSVTAPPWPRTLRALSM